MMHVSGVWIRFVSGFIVFAGLNAGCAGIVRAQAVTTERFYFVEVTDLFRASSLEVLAQGAYDTVLYNINLQNLLLTQALRDSRIAWLANPETQAKGFPSSMTTRASIKVLGVFTSAAQAEARKAKHLEGLPAATEPKMGYVEKRLELLREELKHPPANTRTVSRDRWITNMKQEIAVLEETLAKRNAKKEEQKNIEEAARTLILKEMARLQAEHEARN